MNQKLFQLQIWSKRQQGAVTLVIAIILLVANTVLTFTVARTGLMETRMTNNEYRAMEANQASEGGLEYSIAWLSTNLAAWTNTEDGLQSGTQETQVPPITTPTGDTYNMAIAITRDPGSQYFVQVTSVATSASDPNVTATTTQYIAQDPGPLQPNFNAAPLVINGCLDNVTGNPDVFPSGAGGPGPYGIAIATTQPSDGGNCIDPGQLDLNGGSVEYEAYNGSTWDYIFRKTRGEIHALADAEVAAGVPDSERNYVWVTSTANYHHSWGSLTNPVVLIFAPSADCPKINGSPTIYGIVFIDSACDTANGFGGTEIYGSVIIDGDVSKITANSEFYDFTTATGNTNVQFPPDTAPKILGTWSDF